MKPSEFPPEVVAKFWMNASRQGGCWVWHGAKTKGYGTFAPARFATLRAHRVAYELLVGLIPEGLELDHLCRNTACINPQHLEPVTHLENCERTRLRTCRKGHPLEGENLYVTPKGRRQCRACRADRQRDFRERNPDYYERYKRPTTSHATSHADA